MCNISHNQHCPNKLKFNLNSVCHCIYSFLLVFIDQHNIIHFNKRVLYLFGPFAGLIQVSSAVQRPLDQLFPTGLDAEQQVLDQNHILLQAGEAKLRTGLLQS